MSSHFSILCVCPEKKACNHLLSSYTSTCMYFVSLPELCYHGLLSQCYQLLWPKMESEAMWDGDDKGERYQEEWHRLHQTFSDSHRSIFMHMGCAWTFTGTGSSKLAFIGLHIGLTDVWQPVRLLLNYLPWKAAHLFTCSTIVWMLPQTGLQRLRALRVGDILTLPLDLTWALFARPSLRSDSMI